MFNLKHAGIDLRKAAHLEGIKVGMNNSWYTPMTDNEDGVKAVVGDDTGKEIRVTVFDMEYINQYSWKEIRRMTEKSQPQISIKNLKQFGGSGWSWTQIFVDWDGETVTRDCRTDPYGDGLWYYNNTRAAYDQSLGTCQFTLGDKRSNAYRQIRHYIQSNILQI